MKQDAFQHLQLRLFLHAVFPTLDGVIKASPHAQGLLRDNAFSVCFKSLSGVRASYHFTEGGCDYVSGDSQQSGIGLLFLTDAQAVATFLEKKTFPPIPTRGFSALSKMNTFTALAKEMQDWLKPGDDRLQDEDFREKFAMFSLGLALRGVTQLCAHERKGREQLASGPQGLVSFQIGEDGEPVWLLLRRHELASGEGDLPEEPAARVVFRNSEIAARAVRDEIDSIAAVGRGDIMVQGIAPLADHANALMERVQSFVDPEVAQ
ncbi:MAG: hypothetical protein ACQKBV_01140 [Puniceicoccales bacterium]